MRSDNFDVTIIGAGPAGATAAIMLAQAGRHVALIDKEKFPRVANATGWVSMRIAALLQEIGVPAENVLNRPFRDVTFFSADFAEQAKPNLPEPVGYLIDRPKFENALIQAATDSGATLIDETTVSEVRLKETAAEAKLSSGEQIDSRLLLLATGRNASLLDRAGFSNTPPIKPMWTAQVELPLAKFTGAHCVLLNGQKSVGQFFDGQPVIIGGWWRLTAMVVVACAFVLVDRRLPSVRQAAEVSQLSLDLL